MEVGYGTLENEDDEHTKKDSDTSSSDKEVKSNGSKGKYPYSVFFILSNEFCERFSYYGMRAILVLYLTRWLRFGEDQATAIFHSFSMLAYIMPLIGAVIADGYLGKYRTILYLSCVYFLGNFVLSVTSVPPPEWIGPCIGLVLIACGTGGIKASVAPFGADQFKEGQEKWQSSFFSAFYFMINLGSTISILLTPILRADVSCYGQDCYILAFGIPAILMFLSIILFFCGRNMYIKIPPTGNIIGRTFKCIFYGIKGKLCATKYEEKRSHWLYYADDRFDAMFIEDVRQLLKVLVMFLPLPIFWALENQQGSRWTLQAEHMDGDMGVFGTLKPDQMQALNPVLILVFIPLFDKIIYPLLDKCRIPNRPLQRMVAGLYISSLAFVVAGLVQIKIDGEEVPMISKYETGVSFINTVNCPVTVRSHFHDGKIQPIEMSKLYRSEGGNYSVQVKESCGKEKSSEKKYFMFEEGLAYRIIIYLDKDNKIHVKQFEDQRDKPKQGDAAISIFSATDFRSGYVTLISTSLDKPDENVGTHFNITQYNATAFTPLLPTVYSLYVANADGSNFTNVDVQFALGTGGVYTVFISGDEADGGDAAVLITSSESSHFLPTRLKKKHLGSDKPMVNLFIDVQANTVSILWMIPQYVIITVGEVLFSVTGLAFAYSQSPASLKSVVQAMWLMTTALGDLIVIIIANIDAIPNQKVEFFLFAILTFIDTVIFMIMAIFYTYKPNSLYSDIDDTSPTSVKQIGEELPLQIKHLE